MSRVSLIGPVLFLIVAVASSLVADSRSTRDFRPFLMTIEIWNAEAVGLSDGTRIARTETYRLEYWDRRNWTMTRIDDPERPEAFVQGSRCSNGASYSFDADTGTWQWRSNDPGMCNGVGRWIHWGQAWTYPWKRVPGPEPGQVTLTDPGERIVYDLATGLPIVYEAGPISGPVKYRETHRLERFLLDQ